MVCIYVHYCPLIDFGHKLYRLFDVSKQVVGQMFVHGVNLLVSDLTAHRSGGGNACVFYFLNILIDTTLGDVLIHWI
jgi:hypothetical protein